MTEKDELEFFNKFGANKIWVTPSQDNVETILDIWKFITRKQQELVESILAEIPDKYDITKQSIKEKYGK